MVLRQVMPPSVPVERLFVNRFLRTQRYKDFLFSKTSRSKVDHCEYFGAFLRDLTQSFLEVPELVKAHFELKRIED